MNIFRRCALVVALMVIACSEVRTCAASEEAYYKACFLQAEQGDFAAAAELFQQVAASDEAPAEIRKAAKRRLSECREEVATADLASLMPAETLVYLQLANVGQQARTILNTLGVANEQGPAARSGDRIPIEPGLSLPLDFALSPALVREVGKIGGIAVAITGIDERGVPRGVAVLHLGRSDLVRGLVETGLQIVTPNEAIGDYATYRIPFEGEQLWLVKTERLLVLSHSREEVAAAVRRIGGDGASLAASESFRNAAEARGESLLFAWADSQRAAPIIDALMAREMRPEEFVAARTVLNLQAIECATFAIGATEGGARAQASVKLKPGQQHLLYGLIRTAPIGDDALEHVPASAAAVAAIGLNPPLEAPKNPDAATPQLALIDIGRELFANVRSITVFVLPGEGPIPEVGVVVLAQDGGKSKELWTRLMGLPALFGAVPPDAVQETEMRGRATTQYAYPGAPPVFVTQPSDHSLVVGTAGAVEASLAALDEGKSLISEADGAKLKTAAGPATSKAVLLRGGQLLKLAQPTMGGNEGRVATVVGPLLTDLTASLTVDEQASELSVRAEVSGVPRVSDMLRAAAAANAQRHVHENPQVDAGRAPTAEVQLAAP